MPVLTAARVLVAAGGTGGHLTPALAVADELSARGAEVTFVTTPSQVERVGRRYPVHALEMRGFERRLRARENLTTAATPRAGDAASLEHRRRRAAHAAVGGGRLPERARGGRGGRPRRSRPGDRERRPPRGHQPAAAPVREAALPELPDRGSRAAEVRRDRTAALRDAAGCRAPQRGRAAFGLRATCRRCWSSAAARGRRASISRASRRSAAAARVPARPRLRRAELRRCQRSLSAARGDAV